MTCTWTPDTACLGDQWDLNTTDPELWGRSLSLATSALQGLTYNRVGTCPITIRPCPQFTPCGCQGSSFHPHRLADGSWINTCPCGNPCEPISEVDIPGPVGFIDSFKIGGVEQDLTTGDWRLDDGHLLVWQGDGPSPVPVVQDLNKPDSEPDTWSITYSRSYPVQQDARVAVALLAAEFAKACLPRSKCALPRGVTSVVRNGVSFTIEAGLFPSGLTGIELVDIFILKWAPAGSPTRSAVVGDPRSLSRRARRTNSVPLKAAGTGFGGGGFGL